MKSITFNRWAAFLSLFALALPVFGRAPNIQGIPTPTIYLTGGSSYDAMSKYNNGDLLNGKNQSNPAHLGCTFARSSYVATQNAFGILAFDNMVVYSAGALNGLNGPDNWSGPYVDQVNAWPAITFDSMTNYAGGVVLNGLNAGTSSAVDPWNGPYVDLCLTAPPGLTYSGGVIVSAVTIPGFDNIVVSFDGTTPDHNNVLGSVSSILIGSGPPVGTYVYDGAFTLPWNATVQAVQGHGIFGWCGNATLANALSFGETWSNNVVINGGASPSTASVNAINVFGAGLNNDGLLNQSLGAYPSIQALNVFAPDSLIACMTPQIYASGVNPWINHNFVAGDLSVNGLVGNGSTKYINSGVGFISANKFQMSSSGVAAYCYNVPASAAVTLGMHDNSPPNSALELDANISGSAYGLIWSFNPVTEYIGPLPPPGNGFLSAQRVSSTKLDLYFANSSTAHASLGTQTTLQTGGLPTGGQPAYIFSLNNAGTPLTFSPQTISFVEFNSTGFSAASDQKLYNRIQTLRTAFGGGWR